MSDNCIFRLEGTVEDINKNTSRIRCSVELQGSNRKLISMTLSAMEKDEGVKNFIMTCAKKFAESEITKELDSLLNIIKEEMPINKSDSKSDNESDNDLSNKF